MLVLSRGKNDKVVFPTLGISVEIVRIAGNKVRLGIDAPKDVPVYRHEVVSRAKKSGEPIASDINVDREHTHKIKNRLQSASLALHVLQRKLELGKAVDPEFDVFNILNELKALERELPQTSPNELQSPSSSNPRALIVEDDDNERNLLSGYLDMSGFEVDTAADGMQAMVRLAKEERPDVVLLDMRMPRFDGEQTISAIRSNPSYEGLKVFAVSGTPQNETNVSVSDEGVDRWFEKPLDPNELVTAIKDEICNDERSDECLPT